MNRIYARIQQFAMILKTKFILISFFFQFYFPFFSEIYFGATGFTTRPMKIGTLPVGHPGLFPVRVLNFNFQN